MSRARRRRDSERNGAVAVVLIAAAVAASGCKSPSDVIFERPPFTATAESTGRFRVTYGSGADVLRGFTPDGRLMFRTRDLPPFGPGWVLVSVPPDGGFVREEASIYRQAVLDVMGALAGLGDQRVLALWKPPVASQDLGWDDGCPSPAPAVPAVKGVSLLSLPAADGVALANIPRRYVNARTFGERAESPPDPPPVTFTNVRVRVTPAIEEVRIRGVNPFGPVLVPGSSDVLYSDGEAIWQASLTDTSQAPVLVAAGAFPSLSGDGALLAYARPVDVDSTTEVFMVPVGLGLCIQEQVQITAGGWQVVVRDLASGDEHALSDGVEPVFDPAEPSRLLVRRSSLEWVDLATGTATPIAATEGAFAPAISPDGRILAFSLFTPAESSDVYYLPIDR